MARNRSGSVGDEDPGQAESGRAAAGIPESLYGRIDPREMGARAGREVAPVPKKKPIPKSDTFRPDADLAGLSYRPKTKESRQLFEFMAGLIHRLMGSDLPHDATLSATDEVLAILKLDDVKDLDKKARIESFIGPVDNDSFGQLLNLSKRITDYSVAEESPKAVDEEDTGVAVVFEESDEDEFVEDIIPEEEEEAEVKIVQGDDIFAPEEPTFYEAAAMDIDEVAVPKEELDLDALAFKTGGHTMTNKKCVVPERSFKKSMAGWEEIHIPAPAPKGLEPGEKLVPIGSLPSWAQPAFSGFDSLNRIQSRVYPKAFGSDENLLMCAPTGAGKTNVALLSMLNEIGKHWRSDGTLDLDAFKIVYIAPMKALVQEMVQSFGRRLAPFGIAVAELTGDQQLTKAQIAATQVIVTTPEKWDVITRKGNDQSYTRLVRLVIIDEIHLLHDDRGPVLEALVCRILRQCEETQQWVRLVGLSATLPNYGDVGRFLRVPSGCVFFFDSSFRPCPLAQQFIGVTEKNSLKRMNLMNDIVYEKVAERAGQYQMIVFVHSRKDTAKTAKYIRDVAIQKETISAFGASKEYLINLSEQAKSGDLKDLLPYGFAIHHAGMTRPDRNLVEQAFAEGHIQVLVSTATLAWGVNLPAHTVIIKGTQVYNPERGQWTELSAQDTFQMLGRAGRPQYDTQGEGIIITTHGELQFYLSLLNQQLPIESQLISRLMDHLNAEVVLGSIRSLSDATEWIGYTYLAVRMTREPAAYGVPAGYDQRKRRSELAHTVLSALDKASLVRYDRRTGQAQATELGRIASHYYVGYHSMATYNEHLRPYMDEIDLFRVFSLSQEFKLIPVRHEEKIELVKLAERVPIPIKETPDEPVAKINILLQAYISQLALEGFALASDMVYVTQSAGRILRAIFEMCLRRGWARLAKKALDLCKMVDRRQWLSMTPLRQIKNGALQSDILRRIENKDFPFERLFDLNPQELGELIRVPKLGRVLHDQLRLFPRLKVEVQSAPIARDLLRLDIAIEPQFDWDQTVHGVAEQYWILIEDVDEEHVLHVEPFVLKQRWATDEHRVTMTVPILEPLPPAYFVTVVSDRWLQAETRVPVMLMNMILPDKPSSVTEADVDTMDVAEALAAIPGLADQYSGYMDRLQSQAYPALFKSDENVLFAAPIGSSLICAELAIARSLANNPAGKVVFMSPHQDRLDQLDWETKLAVLIPEGKQVVKLTGDSTTDLKLLERGAIILTTPAAWDLMSRRWKNRKNVQATALFIVDDLHLMTAQPVIECVTSRMRYISAYLEQTANRKIRIVALSTTLSTAKDVCSWLGVPQAACFNFDLDARPSRLAIQLQGFPVSHHASALLSMVKPIYKAITKQAIVFVEDRRQALITAAELLALSTSDAMRHAAKTNTELSTSWLHPEQIDSKWSDMDKELAMGGIGVISNSKFEAEQLFIDKSLQVLVVAKEAIHKLRATAELVLVQGTQTYNGKEHRYIDYPVADILQMLSFAQSEDLATALICCPVQRKAFYKRILAAPLPVESGLDHVLADVFNAEITVGTIQGKQDAVDYLTWSYFYRRLAQNPLYYGLADRSARHISEHLSEVVEAACEELSVSKCIEIDSDGVALSPLNLGIIAAYYNLSHLTVEMFAMSLQPSTKLRGIMEIVAAATEYAGIPIRHSERDVLEKVYERCPVKQSAQPRWNDPHFKTVILLQAHFSRLSLPTDLELDQRAILIQAVPLIQAIVDVISSHGWLQPALAAMEFSQMLVQAQWDYDSPLKQLPHFSSAVLNQAQELGIESVFDLIDDDDKRTALLKTIPKTYHSAIASAVNNYPNVELEYQISPEQVEPSGQVSLVAQLKRDNAAVTQATAPFYPAARHEAWWLIVGNPSEKTLLGIKRVAPKPGQPITPISIDFAAPPTPGSASLKVYLISDCWIGCDQEFDASLLIE